MICGESVQAEYEDEEKQKIKTHGYEGYNCVVLDKLDLEKKANNQ